MKDKHGHVVTSVVCRKQNSKSFYYLNVASLHKHFQTLLIWAVPLEASFDSLALAFL